MAENFIQSVLVPEYHSCAGGTKSAEKLEITELALSCDGEDAHCRCLCLGALL